MRCNLFMPNECLVIFPDTPFEKWYFSNKEGKNYAEKCKRLIYAFNKPYTLEVYETRRHEKGSYVCCWYVSFEGIRPKKISYILQFEIRKSNATIGFRCADYTPKEKFRKKPSIINRGKSEGILYNDYNETELIEMIEEYLRRIRKDFDEDKLHCKKRHPCESQRKEC